MVAVVLTLGGGFLMFGGHILMTLSHMDEFIRLGRVMRGVLTGISVKLMVIVGLLAAFAIGMEIGNYINQWDDFRTAVQRVMAALMLVSDIPTLIQAAFGDEGALQRIKAYWDIASGTDPVTGKPFAASMAYKNVSIIDAAVGEMENMFYRAGEAAERAAGAINSTGDAIKSVGDAAAALPEAILPGGFPGAGPAPAAPAVATGRQTQELANLIAERERLMGSYATEKEFLLAIGQGQVELSAAELIRYGNLRKLIAEKQTAIDRELEQEAAQRRAIKERWGMQAQLYEVGLAQRASMLEAYGTEAEFLANATLEELERFNELEERLIGYQDKLQEDTPWTRWIANAQRASNITNIGFDAMNNAVNSLSGAVGKGIVKAFGKAENAVISFFATLMADIVAAIVKALLLKAILTALGMPAGGGVPGIGTLLSAGFDFQGARADFWARHEGGRILDLFTQGIERTARGSPLAGGAELGSDTLADQPFTFAPNIVIEDPSPTTKIRIYDEWFAERAEELEAMTTEAD